MIPLAVFIGLVSICDECVLNCGRENVPAWSEDIQIFNTCGVEEQVFRAALFQLVRLFLKRNTF